VDDAHLVVPIEHLRRDVGRYAPLAQRAGQLGAGTRPDGQQPHADLSGALGRVRLGRRLAGRATWAARVGATTPEGPARGAFPSRPLRPALCSVVVLLRRSGPDLVLKIL